jgi:hypothetical protein
MRRDRLENNAVPSNNKIIVEGQQVFDFLDVPLKRIEGRSEPLAIFVCFLARGSGGFFPSSEIGELAVLRNHIGQEIFERRCCKDDAHLGDQLPNLRNSGFDGSPARILPPRFTACGKGNQAALSAGSYGIFALADRMKRPIR